ncbi:MAG TPA: ROK family transcriptional regulator [Phototrophicaceae bacterium]|nr:ROK family transcriptional regulator [Phototrophicaceae bacterium]
MLVTTRLRGNKDLIKAINRSLILNTLRRNGSLSRTQLTEISGLSVGAVSQITNELIDSKWLLEVGEGDYTGGRRQVLLRLNPNAGFAIGVKLMETRAICAVTNLETEVRHYAESETGHDHSPTAITAMLCALIERAMREADVSEHQILGVGIGLAGVIDSPLGMVHYSPFFGWRDVPLAEMVKRGLGIDVPVYAENDVNTLTLTEQLFGEGRHAAHFAVVTIGRGVGMGMVIHHQLYQGMSGGVGELGHITIDPNGPKCDCGKRGCLESLASDTAVLAYVQSALAQGEISTLTHPATLADVIQAADGGDALARYALARSGSYIGMGLAVVVNILCPPLIVISGEGVAAGDHRLAPMFTALRQHVFNGLLENVRVIVKPADDRAWARGAAGMVIGKVFESPLTESNG